MPAHLTTGYGTTLDRELGALVAALVDDRGVVTGLRLADDLRRQACRVTTPGALDQLVALADQRDDQLAAIAAVHALSALPGRRATRVLADRLDDDRGFVGEHAAWALSARAPHPAAMDRLAGMVAGGGFRGMIAQRTLLGWARDVPGPVLVALRLALRHARAGRTAVADAIGEIPGREATTLLTRLAATDDPAQTAAIAALGWRPDTDDELLETLARRDDEVGRTALLALVDRGLVAGPGWRPRPADAGLGVVQVVLHADLASSEDRSGVADNGGVATLTRQLAAALAARPELDHVTTVCRGSIEDAIAAALSSSAGRERVGVVPLPEGGADRRSGWVHRVAVERGLRRVLHSGARPDVVHLRMADVGSLAADRVARRLGVPTAFTSAPDPHAVLDQLALDRAEFGVADEAEHWWFRARMVERLQAHSDLVLRLPRRDAAAEHRRYFGPEAAAALDRAPVVPEGIDAGPIAAALATLRGAPADPPEALRPLLDAVAALAPARQGLPLVVSVGRLHHGKGFDRLAAAWSGDPHLRAQTNLVIVGGDLDHPSDDERAVLDELAGVVGDVAARRDAGVVLLGHQPNVVVAHVLAAASVGLDPYVAPGGVYVGAASKEEFGLALVEALAAGLVVVAPRVGGPATYVSDGRTGVLADTTSVPQLTAAIAAARDLVAVPGRAEAAIAQVRDELTIDAMAGALVGVYAVAGATTAKGSAA